MNDKQRTQYMRQLQGMRAMTPKEIAAKQVENYRSMMNAPMPNYGDAARNFWQPVGASPPAQDG